jgi:hypothetical protein
MPRKPSPKYWKTRRAYYCSTTLDTGQRRQHLLAAGPDDAPDGPCFLAALDEFKKLMEAGNLDTAGDDNTVRAVLDAYLVAAETKLAPNTFEVRLRQCRIFAARYGDLPVTAIKPYHVEAIITEMAKPRQVGKRRRPCSWKPGTVRTFLAAVKRAFSWAVKAELITKNPLRHVPLPDDRTASRERTLTPAEYQIILGALCKKRHTRLRRLVVALENTGARPGELAAVSWSVACFSASASNRCCSCGRPNNCCWRLDSVCRSTASVRAISALRASACRLACCTSWLSGLSLICAWSCPAFAAYFRRRPAFSCSAASIAFSRVELFALAVPMDRRSSSTRRNTLS